jgi:hypothetical protein
MPAKATAPRTPTTIRKRIRLGKRCSAALDAAYPSWGRD